MNKTIILFVITSLTAHAMRFNSVEYRACSAKANSAFKAAAQECFSKHKGKERSKCLSPHAKVKDSEIKLCQQADKKRKDKVKQCQMNMPADKVPSFKECHAMKDKFAKNKCMDDKRSAFQAAIDECAAKP